MEDRLWYVRIGVLVIIGISCMYVWTSAWGVSAETQVPYLQVSFFDVGQGDAIFIRTPDGIETLIDGGRNTSALRLLAQELGVHDRSLDLLVGTHPDIDHIGGLIDILSSYDVSHIVRTEHEGKSAAAERYFNAIEEEDARVTYARAGQEFLLGASTTLKVLFPSTNVSKSESNASSIILQLVYGDIEFLFTGDAPHSVERDLVSTYGGELESEVLKAGHHGSRTSSDAYFVEVVDPDYVVVSAGANNSYGHPHKEVTDLFAKLSISMLETAEAGTITFYSDGTRVWLE